MTGAERNNIKEENRKRLEAMYAPYDPVSGVGSPLERVDVNFTYNGFDYSFKAPLTMYDENKFVLDALNETGTLEKCMEIVDPEGTTDPSDFFEALIENRFKHDFEFWAYQNAKIQEKKTKSIIRFLLNRPQRKTLMSLEKQRLAGIPIRTIILKARQWGGSTFTQIYMAWLQLLHYENWHSLIVTDVENQARTIRGMYTRLLNRYPKRLGEYSLTPFEGSTKNRIIKERGCVISIGSAQKPESLRSNDVSMAHLSEVAFWQTTPQKSAEDLLQTIRPSIPSAPGTLIVMESTAKGVGSLFHNEWLSAKAGESGYDPVFVAWHEIEMYQKNIEPEELDKFIDTVFNDPYLAFLWKEGATLEGINWYRWYKASENWSDWRMQSEYPSTDLEAFASTNQRVFAPEYVKNLRKTCRKPELTGEIRSDAQKGKEAFNNISFVRDSKGNLLIWALPDTSTNGSNRYVVSVDIGGRTPKADYSIIKVIDRYWMEEGGYPETVATWRGHCFVPGTLIYTSKGFKNIEDIKVGDLVWTHKNRFRKVIRTFENKYEGEVISIRAKGNYETVTCTPEHPFFGNNVTRKRIKKPWRENRYRYPIVDVIKEPEWIHAQELKYISYSKNHKIQSPKSFTINKYNGGKSKHTTHEITDLKSFYSILGYYLAEGHINKRSYDNKPSSIFFSFSYHERNTVVKDCYDKLIKLGFNPVIKESKNVGVCRIKVYNTFLSQLVLELCGEHSWEKKICPLILEASNELLSELLYSYWKGDGSKYKCDATTLNTISTVSPILARQVRDILILLEKRPSIYRVIAKTKGVGIKTQRPRYNIVWNASEVKKYATLQNDSTIVYKVNSKKLSTYTGLVYNLEVEEDNSYSTACYVVHNCDQDLIAWKAAIIAKYYNDALLVVESNSLDKDTTDGDHFLTVLDEIVPFYENVYARNDPEKIRQGLPLKYGWMTTQANKSMAINTLNACAREESFVERDSRVCDEMDTYEIKPNGSLGAVEGCHDDLVMATAIGLWICVSYLDPFTTKTTRQARRKIIVSEATI